MKQAFINEVKNKHFPAEKSLQKLADLTQEAGFFEPLDNARVGKLSSPHFGDNLYFNQKAARLERNFSYELCKNLLEVKQFLQKQGDAEFVVIETETSTQNDEENKMNQATYKEPDLNNFKPLDYLNNDLNSDDLAKVRSDLITILNDQYLSIEEVLKSIYYVFHKKPAVFEEAELNAYVLEFSQNEADWNMDYFFKQQVYLNRNFSLERLLHLLNVREMLMKKGDPNFQPLKAEQPKQNTNTAGSASQPKPNTSKPSGNPVSQPHSENDFLRKVAIIGGAVLAAVTALFLILR